MASNDECDDAVVPEVQIFYEGGPDISGVYNSCKKNPGHEGFIAISKLKPEHIDGWRGKTGIDLIKCCSDLTVKVIVKYTSDKRPDVYPDGVTRYPFHEYRGSSSARRCGTGFIHRVGEKPVIGLCPCFECVESGQPKMQYFEISVITSSHVIFTSSEAASAVCQLFFDSDDSTDAIRCIYGSECIEPFSNTNDNYYFEVDDTEMQHLCAYLKCNCDRIILKCISHDCELAERLFALSRIQVSIQSTLIMRDFVHEIFNENSNGEENTVKGFFISHPHGASKKISIGNLCRVIYSDIFSLLLEDHATLGIIEIPEMTKCRLPLHPWSRQHSVEQHMGYDLLSTSDSTLPQSNISCDKFLTPGTVNTVPFELTVISPGGNNGVKYCHAFSREEVWVTFQKGTTFVDSHTAKTYIFPPEAEFLVTDHKLKWKPYYVAYDIPTCSGCSGGRIIHDLWYLSNLHHEGALTKGMNRSEIPLAEECELYGLQYSGCAETPESLLFSLGIDPNHLEMDDECCPWYCLHDNDDYILIFTRWRLRKRLRLHLKNIHFLKKMIGNNDDVDGDEEYNIEAVGDNYRKSLKILLKYFAYEKTDKDKSQAMEYVLEISDETKKLRGNIRYQIPSCFQFCFGNKNNDDGEDGEDYRQNCDDKDYHTQDNSHGDAKSQKKRRWSVVLDKLRDKKSECRMVELYGKFFDSPFRLPEAMINWLRGKLLDSLRSHREEWRKIKQYVEYMDPLFYFWEEDDDNVHRDDIADNLLRKTKACLRRRLMDKLRSMDAGEMDWEQIRYWETIVSPVDDKGDSMSHEFGLDISGDQNLKQAVGYVLDVNSTSPVDNDKFEYPSNEFLNELLCNCDSKFEDVGINELRSLMRNMAGRKHEWRLIFYYMCRLDSTFDFVRENLDLCNTVNFLGTEATKSL